ncbi:ornithine cyclodeaminase family protein [Paractinoplanes lichenicola]|uniref:Ornithine cyclodeaminase family protein n=1 Tax=Paractinoplanes lichenicola TaxID=2802976 RepID=A0ABS1VLK0_9ACTN|nr:ornithine cyclodeaminase family protein [Actinoplanes lichenicola]MBL7255514.1 ornithine cyclodeaminase family protein [Actinoplanes lichenicola]
MIEADQVAALGFPGAIAALREALAAGLDPESEPARSRVELGGGEILMMPSGDDRFAGIKLVGVAPGNPAHNLPRIHGVYVLFDAPTLVPRAILDGAALTSLRTPAVSALGVDLVAPADARRLVVFGTGPQALGHIEAIRAVRPIDSVQVVGRDRDRVSAFARELGLEAAGPEAVADADIVACCTTAREPLFDGKLLRDDAVVVAVGSHEPEAREVDAETVRRCGALVESRAVAMREAGDLILAGTTADELTTLADLVRGVAPARPRLIKTVGMGWEDLVIAAAVVESLS